MYKDKHTKTLHKENEEIEITEERYKELTTSPLGVFVKEIKELPKKEEEPKFLTKEMNLPKQQEPPMYKEPEDLPKEPKEPPKEDDTTEQPTEEKPQIDDSKLDSIAFTKMKKEDLIKYAKEVMTIDLNMDMTKPEMIEILLKK